MNSPSAPVSHGAISLREECAGDESFLLTLFADVRQEELDPLGWDLSTRAAFLEMQFKAMRMGYANAFPHANFSIILQNEKPIGRAVVNHAEKEIRLVDVALL